jgi:hypothetical protein
LAMRMTVGRSKYDTMANMTGNTLKSIAMTMSEPQPTYRHSVCIQRYMIIILSPYALSCMTIFVACLIDCRAVTY